jgi:hypothetical protein
VSKALHIRPIDAWSDGLDDGSVCSQDHIVNLPLLLREHTVNWVANCDIGSVVVDLVLLVRQHHLPFLELLVISIKFVSHSPNVLTAPDDTCVWHDSATEVVHFTIEFEQAFELELSHACLGVPHHVHLRLTGSPRCPSHDFDFLGSLENSGISEDSVE